MKKTSLIRAFIEKATFRSKRNINAERVRTRALRLESLESRELLSVAPGGDFQATEALAVYESGVATNVDSNLVVLSDRDALELVSSGSVVENSAVFSNSVNKLLADVAATGWTAGKRWFYYDDGMYDWSGSGYSNWNSQNKTLKTNGPLCKLIDQAQGLGLNGMVWKCGVEDIASDYDERITFLQQVKSYAEERGIEIIPTFWFVGVNAFLQQDASLVEGKFIEKAPIKLDGATGGDSAVVSENFEGNWTNVPTGWSKTDPSAELGNYVAKDAGASGGSSVRVTLPTSVKSDGITRVFTGLEDGYYYVTCKVKIKTVQNSDYAEMTVLDADHQENRSYADYKRGNDNYVDNQWGEMTSEVIRVSSGKLAIQLSGGGAKGEKMWFDDVEIHLANQNEVFLPIPRDGTPIKVYQKTSSGGYEEIPQKTNGKTNWKLPDGYKESFEFGYDETTDAYGFYAEIGGEKLHSVQLEIPTGSQILKNNLSTIYVDYYAPKSNQYAASRYSACLSEEKLYDLMAQSAVRIQNTLQPKTWFIAFDEVTIGATCETCRETGLTAAQIFGKSVSRQYDIIKSVDPDAEIVVWSDMFDPSHNATEEPYQDVAGSLKDVAKYIPNDLIIACWYDSTDPAEMTVEVVKEHAVATLEYFSDLGFRTISSCYYDWSKGFSTSAMPTSSLDLNTQGWLSAIVELNGGQNDELNGNVGMFYLTWLESGKRDYDYLDSFGTALNQIKLLQENRTIKSITLNTISPKVGQTLTATLSPSGANSQTSATFQWYRKENAFDEERNKTLDWKVWKKIGGATSATYEVQNADLGKELKVVAVGVGNYAGTAAIETKTVARDGDLSNLNVPANPRETAKTSTTISVAWDAVPNADGYRLVYKNKTDSSYTYVPLDKTTTSYKLTGLQNGAIYNWKVQALGDKVSYLNSAFCATRTVKAGAPETLSAPANSRETAKTSTTITVAWDAVPNASGYRLTYKNKNDASYTTVSLGASTTSHKLTGLENGATYYWRVLALGDSVSYLNSANSATRTVKTSEPVQLAAPANPRETAKASTTITVAWDAVPNASGYRLVYKNKTDSSYTYVQLAASKTSYKLTGLDSSAIYNWKVQALGDKVSYLNSAYCATQTVRMSEPVQLAAPVPSVAAKTSTTITASWNAVPNASGYRFVWKNKTDSSYTYVQLAASTTSYKLSGLDPNATYNWKVQALGDKLAYLNSGFCATQTDKPQQTLASPSASFSASPTSIVFSWSAVANASSYRVSYRQAGGSYTTVEVDSSKRSYTIADVKPKTTYTLRVAAIGDGLNYLNSANSTLTFTTPSASSAVLDPGDGLFDEMNDEDYDLLAANFIA